MDAQDGPHVAPDTEDNESRETKPVADAALVPTTRGSRSLAEFTLGGPWLSDALTDDSVMRLSASSKYLNAQFDERRRGVLASKNWGTTKRLTAAQIDFAAKVVRKTLCLEHSIHGPRDLLKRSPGATPEEKQLRRDQLDALAKEQKYPPLCHVLMPDGTVRPEIRNQLLRYRTTKMFANVAALGSVVFGIGQEAVFAARRKRRAEKIAPFIYSDDAIRSMADRVLSGAGMREVAEQTGISLDTLFHTTLAQLKHDAKQTECRKYAAVSKLDFSGIDINSISVNATTRLIDLLSPQTGLLELNLANNGLDDKTALEMAKAAAKHPALKTLDLSGSNITEETKQKIGQIASDSGKTILV
jgi:Leucine-rich repeat (LRR) protein